MAKINFSLKKFLISNWFVTLFSTMLGVIAGLYLTDHYDDVQLNKSKLNALEMVKQEIENNKEALFVYDSICRSMYDKSSYVFSKMNADNEIYIDKDSIEVFKKKSEGMIGNMTFEPSTIDKLQVRGDMNMFVSSKLALVDLNDVIWQSYKQTNYINATNFNCITSLEELYQFQAKNNTFNREWMNQLMKGYFLQGEKELDEFMFSWVKALEINLILLNAYDNTESIFKNCN